MKKKAKDNERIVTRIYASDRMVASWLGWLYGQPMFAWIEDITDEVLENYVEMYELALEEQDYGCLNACLDTIREYLCQPNEFENPIAVLKPVLKSGFDELGHLDNEKPSNMIVDVLVYGPCADSGRTAEWLKELEWHYKFSLGAWAWFYQKTGNLSATKLAQASEVPDNIPDYMSEHAYHFCEEGKLCCGRKVPVNRKRKAVDLEEYEEVH